jgi:hypothetical protein
MDMDAFDPDHPRFAPTPQEGDALSRRLASALQELWDRCAALDPGLQEMASVRAALIDAGGVATSPATAIAQSWLQKSGDRGKVIDAFPATPQPGATEAGDILALVLVDEREYFVIHARQCRSHPRADPYTRIAALESCRDFAMIQGAGQRIGEVQRRWGLLLGWNPATDMEAELATVRDRMPVFPAAYDDDGPNP